MSAPGTLARPTVGLAQFGGASQPAAAATAAKLTPGKHLAVGMVPVGGASKAHPALFVIRGQRGQAPVAILSTSAPDPSSTPTSSPAGTNSTTPTSTPSSTPAPSSPTAAQAFPFALPKPPGPGGTQALATNTTDGGVVYDVAYALVTVTGGGNVTNTNSAYALAHCNTCTTVAVSFQLVLIVGPSRVIAPINAAGALNYNCPACVTTALADQIVVTLTAQPSRQLLDTLTADLKQLNALPALGAGGTPAAVAAEVGAVQQEIDAALKASGLEANPPSSSSTSTTTTTSSTTTPAPSTPTSSSQSTTGSSGPATPAATTRTSTGTTPTSTSTTSTETTPTVTTSTGTTPTASTPSG